MKSLYLNCLTLLSAAMTVQGVPRVLMPVSGENSLQSRGIVVDGSDLIHLAKADLDPFDVIRQLKSDPSGIKHVADDGIVRSFNGMGEEIDSAPLSNMQLMAIAASMPNSKRHLEDVWHGVNGYTVPEEQIWSPAPHLLPVVLRRREGHGLDAANDDPSSNETNQDGEVNQRCQDLFCTKNGHCEQAGCLECVILDRHDLDSQQVSPLGKFQLKKPADVELN
ncbi:hypothetical protein EMCG_09341 [[Emmonsia] crescens]|uniref:Uncharacterized protein n=1 Tax=[Emmonsia] crescens TaxID=73230 RepID=A0A0G2I302_9EURO|nr:hypothetical protein EMCG_09341 [Emmonsia crescens UAMH 3008]